MSESLEHACARVKVLKIQSQADAGVPNFTVCCKAKFWVYEVINVARELGILFVCVAGHVLWMAALNVARRDVVAVE